MAEKKPDTLTRITSMFAKPHHEDYPVRVAPYEGPVNELHRYGEVGHAPIDTSVSVYHPGTSDEHARHVSEVHEVEPKKTHESALKKITSIFTKTTHADLPHSEPYLGTLDNFERRHELTGEPLDSHVSIYHSGRSDEVPTGTAVEEVHAEPVTDKKTDTLTRITTVFKKTHHDEFPVYGTPYEGPMGELIRRSEVDGFPLDTHVSVYHTGRSDDVVKKALMAAPSKPEEVAAEKKEVSAIKKITSLFKRQSHEEFPRTEPFTGELSELERRHELTSEGIDTHVSAYHHGRSDEPIEATPSKAGSVKKTDALGRITSIFTTSKSTVSEFPVHGALYEGPVNELHRYGEVGHAPIDTSVSVYHPGTSDEHARHDSEIHEVEPKKPHESPFQKITSIFTKTTHADHPISEPYMGELADLERRHDLYSEPMHTSVSAYHTTGRSDEVRPTMESVSQAEPVITEKKEAVSGLQKISSIFAARKHEDFPQTEPYEGPLSRLTKREDVSGEPIDTHVSVYHPGTSDEILTEIEPLETEKKTDTLTRITSMFATKHHEQGFPVNGLPYEGPVNELTRTNEVGVAPLDTRVAVYSSGRSDEHPQTTVSEQPPSEPEKREVSALGKLTSFFKKTTAHEDFPHSEPYSGTIMDLGRRHEVMGEPLDSRVSIYHSGRSDEVPMITAVEEVANFFIFL